ncbi:MAG: hypothetical protein ACI4J7_06860 [Ruminiclostridium sp.]
MTAFFLADNFCDSLAFCCATAVIPPVFFVPIKSLTKQNLCAIINTQQNKKEHQDRSLGCTTTGATKGAVFFVAEISGQRRIIIVVRLRRQIFRQIVLIECRQALCLSSEINAIWRKRCKGACGKGGSR